MLLAETDWVEMWSFSIHCTCKPCYHTNEVLKLLYIYTVLCNVCCYLLLPFSTQKALPRRVKQSGVRKSKIMKGTLTRNGLRKKDGHSNAFTMAPADSPAIIADKLVAGACSWPVASVLLNGILRYGPIPKWTTLLQVKDSCN